MPPESSFESARGDLRQLAYRMLGSVQDAEDVVQDAWLRWQSADHAAIAVPRAWLMRTCTRLCIDRLRAAECSPVQYHGDRLPEPWLDRDREPHARDDTLAVALLVTLRCLSAAERAVFLLHDVFDYSFADVAEMLDLAPANCRQLAVRARQRVEAAPRPGASTQHAERLGAAFFAALRRGDIEPLRELLHDDVVLRADGGGKVATLHYPLRGRDRVARFYDCLYVRTGLLAALTVETSRWNAAPGFVLRDRAGAVESVFQFDGDGARICAIFVQRDPDKLRAFVLPPAADRLDARA